MLFAGELAGLVTAITWAVSSQINGYIGGVIGASGITLLRMPFQLFFLGIFCLLGGAAVTFDSKTMLLLLASAVTGLVLGDFALYKAITIIGARAGILLQSLCTSFTAIFGGLFLGETLNWQLGTGVLLATLGVATVITERPGRMVLPGQPEPAAAAKRLGILLGLLCALTFAVSLIMLRAAMKEDLDPLWGGFMRVFIAGSCLWPFGYAMGWSQAAVRNIRVTHMLRLLVFSCFLGAVGMWFSCVTMQHVEAGVGATIIGLQPIWVIITFALWNRSLPSARMMLGSAVAFSGTALVCLH